MATVTHYIRSHYDPKDRAALEVATGQIPTSSDSPHQREEEPEEDPWQTESAFGAERRLAAAPRFVPAVVSYDEVNNMLGGIHRTVLQPSTKEPREDVSGWYRSLTRRAAGEDPTSTVPQPVVSLPPAPSIMRAGTSLKVANTPLGTTELRPDKNNYQWFITRALQSEPPSASATPPPTLADILDREPPVLKQPIVPPVFLALGPANKGWGMLQQRGWSEGEGLGANVPRRRDIEHDHPIASSSKLKLENGRGIQVKVERQEVALDSDGEISELRDVDVVDLTLADSDSEVDDQDPSSTLSGPSTLALETRPPSPHSTPLLTPIPTILKADRLGIGLKAKTVGPYKASKKRVTHNQAALAAHIRANEERRRMKALVGRGQRGFARMAKAEAEQRKQLLASLKG